MRLKIGQLLLQNRLVTESQLQQALKAQRHYGGRLGTNLVELGFISAVDLAKFLAHQLQLPAATRDEFQHIPDEAIKQVSADFAAKYQVIPLKDEQGLRLAISDPAALESLEDLRFRLGRAVEPVIAPEIWIVAALEQYYGVKRETRFITVDETTDSFVGEVINIIAQVADVNELAIDKEVDISLPQYAEEILEAESPAEILHVMFKFLAPYFPNMAVYAVRRQQVTGWLLCGFSLDAATFRQLKIPLDASGPIKRVVWTKETFSSSMEELAEVQQIFTPLKIPKSKWVGFYPLVVRDKVMAVLLGVPLNEFGPPRPESGRIVLEALSKAGMALEILYLRKKIHSTPTPIKR